MKSSATTKPSLSARDAYALAIFAQHPQIDKNVQDDILAGVGAQTRKIAKAIIKRRSFRSRKPVTATERAAEGLLSWSDTNKSLSARFRR